MPITILDYVKSIVGEKPDYTADDFYRNGVDLLGGCEGCHATIAAYNAYPSKSGYWRCADCIGNDGYATVTDFKEDDFSTGNCPACGAPDSLREIRITVDESTEGYALECGECGITVAQVADI